MAVIVSHAAPIGGFGEDPQWNGLALGTASVGGFFAISGYLITRSRERRQFWSYAWARGLRIFPGLWACILVTSFGIAPVIALSNGGWSLSSALSYLPGNMLLHGGKNTVGQVLVGNQFPTAINGSLWTLRYELACYGILGVAAAIPLLWRPRWVTLATFVAASAGSAFLLTAHADSPSSINFVALLAPFFLAGAVLYRFNDVIPASRTIALIAVAWLVLAIGLGFGNSLTAAPLAYLVIWLGARLPLALHRIGAKNDISYGVYVYAFPMQQMLVAFGIHRAGAVVFALASVAVTVPLAWVSWRVVERPAIRLGKVRGRVAGPRKPNLEPDQDPVQSSAP